MDKSSEIIYLLLLIEDLLFLLFYLKMKGFVMADVSKDAVINALRKVDDPDLKRDLVSLNMIKDVVIEKNNVSVTVELTTPACPLKNKIEQDCINAVKSEVKGVENVKINMTAKVTSHNDSKKKKYPPAPSPLIIPFTSTKVAPILSTCSFAAERTSLANTLPGS